MKSSGVSRPADDRQEQHRRRPYLAPVAERISPEKTKALLLQNADPRDPTVGQILDRIEKVTGRGAPQ